MALADKPIRSILLVQTKFLGDLVLVSALVRNLRLHFAGVKIVILCAKGFEDFLVGHEIADAAVTFERKRLRGSPSERVREFYGMIRALRNYRFDATIDLTDSKTSRVISGILNTRIRIGYRPNERPLRWWERQPANLFANPFGYGGKHFLDRYLSPLQSLRLDLLARTPVIDALPPEIERACAFLAEHDLRSGRFIVVHAGAGFKGRCWQPERFAAAIDQIAKRSSCQNFVLIGGPDEADLANTILTQASARIVNLVGKLPLGTLLAVLKQARLFLGNESGPMHLAAAAGAPIVGLFGLTDPTIWGPVGVPHVAVRPSLPCECIEPAFCRQTDPSRVCCVRRLTVEEVVDAVCDLLARTGPADADCSSTQEAKSVD